MLKHVLIGAAGLAVSALVVAPAEATVVAFDVNTAFSGPTSLGTAPYVRIEFDDAVAPGFVRMTASAPGIAAEEWVARIDLNMDPALNPSGLTFSNFQILSGTLLQPLAFLGADQFEADGGGRYDWELQFAVSGGGLTRRFNQGESFSFDLNGIPGLTANSFNFQSATPAPNGQYPTAVLIQGIGPDMLEGWHSVPEPTATSLALIAIGALAARRRRS